MSPEQLGVLEDAAPENGTFIVDTWDSLSLCMHVSSPLHRTASGRDTQASSAPASPEFELP